MLHNPKPFVELQHRLLSENFFEVEPTLEALINPFLSDIALELPVEEIWFRARLGNKAIYQHFEGGWTNKIIRQPWLGSDIGAPPPLNAGIGRLNRAGVSMLYLASDSYTAIAEIRPHPGHYISLGGFRSVEPLRLADFNPNIALFSANDDRLDLYICHHPMKRPRDAAVEPITLRTAVEFLTTAG